MNLSLFDKEAVIRILAKCTGSTDEELRRRLDNRDESLPKICVLSYDVPSIKRYIFSTSDFRGMFGASNALSRFDSLATEELEKLGSHVVIAAGGTGLLICSVEDSKIITDWLNESFSKNVPGAKLIVSRVNLEPYELIYGLKKRGNGTPIEDLKDLTGTGEFSDLFEWLSAKLRERRNEEIFKSFLLTEEIQRCEFCSREAAQIKLIESYDEVHYICPVCKEKRDLANELIKNRKMAVSINDIDVTEDPESQNNLFGVIYIDGNNLGNLYSKIRDERDYREKSQAIERCVSESLKKAIVENKLEGTYSTPIIGGDDLLLFVPAAKLFAVYKTLTKNIEKGFKELGIGFCCGMALVPKKLPVKFVFEVVEELLKSAKKAAYKANYSNPGNYVAFRMLLQNSLNPIQEHFFTAPGVSHRVKETLGKGFPMSEFEEILRIIRIDDPKKFSNLLQKIISCMADDPLVAKLNMRYFYAHGEKSHDLEMNIVEMINKYFLIGDTSEEEIESKVLTLMELSKAMSLQNGVRA
ncbi:Cas10/Cmr2 second palm domain-containing protein [Mesotoga sp. HF07.pep.5.2.highcov]|uniref:Cas10/Cmr2 second palm domain-containing protein n=1 Tax=Mesotoga sp. HF07.pep.5.2.highcov TaxID=1462923 RepID=UPI0011C47831|nr:hypothetical protein [Mesotoga sp. HF07.pep.5.2.highcov]